MAKRSNARPTGKARSTRTGDAAAQGHVSSPEADGRTKEAAVPQNAGGAKVGSDPRAAAHFGDKGDFGIPVRQAQPGQQEIIDGSLDDRPLGTRQAPADYDGRRDVGVGAPDSGPGSGSGGDLDPDYVLGSGIAARPETAAERRNASGPDVTETGTDNLAGGPPARGENNQSPGTHGRGERIQGSVNDRLDRDVQMGESPNDDALQHTDPDSTDSGRVGDRFTSGENSMDGK